MRIEKIESIERDLNYMLFHSLKGNLKIEQKLDHIIKAPILLGKQYLTLYPTKS